jgi:hypothetical protein
MHVAEDPSAGAQDHRPMSRHQGRERRLGHIVAPLEESVEELPVGQSPDCSQAEESADVPEGPSMQSTARHRYDLAPGLALP